MSVKRIEPTLGNLDVLSGQSTSRFNDEIELTKQGEFYKNYKVLLCDNWGFTVLCWGVTFTALVTGVLIPHYSDAITFLVYLFAVVSDRKYLKAHDGENPNLFWVLIQPIYLCRRLLLNKLPMHYFWSSVGFFILSCITLVAYVAILK